MNKNQNPGNKEYLPARHSKKGISALFEQANNMKVFIPSY